VSIYVTNLAVQNPFCTYSFSYYRIIIINWNQGTSRKRRGKRTLTGAEEATIDDDDDEDDGPKMVRKNVSKI